MSAASFIASSRVALPEWIRTWPRLRTSRAMVLPFVVDRMLQMGCGARVRLHSLKAVEPGASRRPTPQRSQDLSLHTILVLVAYQIHDLVVPGRVHEVVDRDVHRVRRLRASAVGELVLRDHQVG